MQEVMQEVIAAVTAFNQQALSLDPLATDDPTAAALAAMDIQVPLFEGNLVILGKDSVAVVVDQFEIISNGVSLVGEYWYSPEGMVMKIQEKESGIDFMTMEILSSKKSTYDIDINF